MIRNRHNYFALGAFMLGAAVILGAFGAHGLEKKISLHYLGTWKTASEYLVYNALGLMAFASFKSSYQHIVDGRVTHRNNLDLRISIFAIILGVFIFSISLYLVSLNQLIGENFKNMGMVAPLGGLLMTLGWFGVGNHFLTHKKQKK
jgi:uncharacterized membrane protein YgdD (TMEM256/DUF423 family)